MYRLAQLAKYKTVLTLAVALLFGLALAPQMTLAQQTTDFGVAELDGDFEGTLGSQDLTTTVARIINVALSLLGIVAVVIILMGGFKWMTAGGSDEKVGEARKLIFSGIIGLAIILSAWAIARFVLGSLSSATGSGTVPQDL